MKRELSVRRTAERTYWLPKSKQPCWTTLAARPTFAQIPAAPTDVRPFVAWRSSIADIRKVGVQTAAEAHAGPWLLSGSEVWADQARAEAVPPAPMTKPAQGDTDAFVREMLRRATPPPRASH